MSLGEHILFRRLLDTRKGNYYGEKKIHISKMLKLNKYSEKYDRIVYNNNQ